MIAIDTNVIVRFLTQDEPIQCKIVNQFFYEIQNSKQFLFICKVTLCEVIWVLEGCYKQTKAEIIEILLNILATPQFIFEDVQVIRDALSDYQETKTVGFADCLIGRNNMAKEKAVTYTFDIAAAKQLKSFKLLTKANIS